MVSLKNGTNPIAIRPEILLAIIVADGIYQAEGFGLVITSLNDSTHADTSRHYQGMAVDIRTRDFTGEIARRITDKLRAALGGQYFVILESNHIHLGYQPKKK